MNPEDFVHLHVHSHFSLLDGACRIGDLARLATQNGMKSLALTDHGNLFGALQFYTAMRNAGVKPIIGYEAYVAPGSRKERYAPGGIKDASFHLTLLAEDMRGYRNLLKLASAAYLEGFYYRPRIDLELLAEHREGLIVLSGCAAGELSHHILGGNEDAALSAAKRYLGILGSEHYFIEVQDNGLPAQKRCVEGLVALAEKLDLGLVATNDIHYAAPEDASAHEVLLCINTGKTLDTKGRMRFGSNEFYFKSGREMIERFGHLPGAVRNTAAIAERCKLELDFDQRHFPHYEPPDGMSSAEYLRKLCHDGLKARLGEPSQEAKNRLEHELEVIGQMNYSSYFLIVWDMIRFAKRRGIPTGLRGSGASAMVCYVLGISDIDPLEYSLIFERFLDPRRREPPDLDIDMCENGREEVLRYVREEYGAENTAQIITFGTMKARAVVRDVGRVLGWSMAEVETLVKRIPLALGTTLESALEQDDNLSKDFEGNPRIRELLSYAFKLEGLARHASTHAAGIVIADKPLPEHIPICKINNVVMSQFAMNDLEKAGMLKLDLLGLRTLTIVDRTLDLVEAQTGTRPDLAAIPLDDPETYALIGRGDTKAVFQLGSEGMQKLLRRLKPQNMADIIAAVAMYRPGPLQSGMVDDYIARRHGRQEIKYLDSRLEPALRDTCGVIVYQEQIMSILHDLAGLSLADALSTIKAISKKKSAVINAREEAFIEGAQANGLPKHVAQQTFELIRHFAEYGFNRAHSTAYAFLAYRTAYLKAHYTMAFAAADLTCEMNHSDKLKDHIRDWRRHVGIEIMPPCVNEGEAHFTVCGDRALRFGMAAVRNVGTKAVEALVAARNAGGPFKNLLDFCERVDTTAMNRQAIESLIKAGAFDRLPGHRSQKLAVLEDSIRAGARTQEDRRRGQGSLFDLGDDAGDLEQRLPPIEEWPLSELSRYEKEMLGMRLSFNPLDRYQALINQLTTANAETLEDKDYRAPVVLAGELVELRPFLTRNGRSMAQLQFEDLHGSFRAVAFPDVFERFGSLLREDAVLFVTGTVERANERVGVQIQDVIPAEEACARLVAAARLTLPREGLETQTLKDLRSICEQHTGDCAVLLEIVKPEEDSVVIRAGRHLFVRPSEEFAADIERLLGKGHLRWIARVPEAQSARNRRW